MLFLGVLSTGEIRTNHKHRRDQETWTNKTMGLDGVFEA